MTQCLDFFRVRLNINLLVIEADRRNRLVMPLLFSLLIGLLVPCRVVKALYAVIAFKPCYPASPVHCHTVGKIPVKNGAVRRNPFCRFLVLSGCRILCLSQNLPLNTGKLHIRLMPVFCPVGSDFLICRECIVSPAVIGERIVFLHAVVGQLIDGKVLFVDLSQPSFHG